jgi:hypothetical protein
MGAAAVRVSVQGTPVNSMLHAPPPPDPDRGSQAANVLVGVGGRGLKRHGWLLGRLPQAFRRSGLLIGTYSLLCSVTEREYFDTVVT